MTGSSSVRGATHLDCTATGERIESEQLVRLSSAGKPLYARYDLEAIAPDFQLTNSSNQLWHLDEQVRTRPVILLLYRGHW